jgi:hypothetical protein
MNMQTYDGNTEIITNIGTNPTERGLTTEQFKAKFDEGLTAFVEWFNDTHLVELKTAPTENIIPYNSPIVGTPGYKNKYWKNDHGEVVIISVYQKGGITDDIGNGAHIFTLPEGCRPSETIAISGKIKQSDYATNYACDVVIYADGKVIIFLPTESLTYMMGQFYCTFVATN